MSSSTGLISINQAKAQGVARVRKPNWAIPLDHIEIGELWHKMYSPFNKECNGEDPMPILSLNFDQDDPIFERYTGALPDSEEYAAAVARYDGCLSDSK